MEDHAVRRPRRVLGQDRQHVLVRLPVVDHHGLARRPRDLDVRAEPVPLDRAGRPVTVVVEAGLADRHHLRRRGQGGDLGQHLAPAVVHLGRVIGVDGDRRVDVRVLGGGRHRPARGRQVAPDVDHPADAEGAGGVKHPVDRQPEDVHVGVRVETAGLRQRCRFPGGRPPTAFARGDDPPKPPRGPGCAPDGKVGHRIGRAGLPGIRRPLLLPVAPGVSRGLGRSYAIVATTHWRGGRFPRRPRTGPAS